MTTLTLVIPGLLRNTHEITERFPALERLFTRSDPLPDEGSGRGLEALFFRLFGVPTEASLPIAAVTHAFDSADPVELTQEGWIRADPVYLEPNRSGIRLFDQRVLTLSLDEAERLAAALSTEEPPTSQGNGRLKVLHPTRWYLPLPLSRVDRIRTSALSVVHGQDIRDHLPQGEDSRAWRKWLTSSQILLHQSPINTEREARGAWPVNSVWLWGEGCTPTVSKNGFSQVWSDDPLVLGLACLAATPHTATPTNAEAWLRQAGTRDLIVLPDPDALAPTEVSAGQDQTLGRLEQDWFAPLQEALQTGMIKSLTLYPCPAPPRYITGSWLRRRWWRRTRPLAHRAPPTAP